MKIVADANIPQVAEAFSDLGNVELIPGREIQRKHLVDCQCLLVRTVTKVNQALLDNTPVEFVGTATIGTDHIEDTYLKKNNIVFTNAAGCNAEAASEYVIGGLFALSQKKHFNPFELTAGVIGCGNVGSMVFQKLTALGIKTLRNDPPLSEKNDEGYVDLEAIIDQCDFITLHVPLTRSGRHSTFHLFKQDELENLRKNCILINAARGPVIDNAALLTVIKQRPDLITFLDTWENEPTPGRDLLARVDLATPHIAGYSVEGRLRGTQMILDAACQYFDKESSWHMARLLPGIIELAVNPSANDLEYWQQVFKRHHDIWQDHRALTSAMNMNDDEFAKHFDSLRRVYPARFEYDRYRLTGKKVKAATIARELLFKT